MTSPLRRTLPLAVAALFAAMPAGCSKPTQAERVPPPPVVTVVKAEQRDVPISVAAIGTTRALNEQIVRARVNGFLEQGPPELFQEGSNVKAGQLLFVIDEAPFAAARDSSLAMLDQAQAEQSQAEQSQAVPIAQARLLVSQAVLALAQVREARARKLLERVSITRDEYDEEKANLQQAEADVQAKKADLDQAKVNFESEILLAKAKVAKAQADLTTAQLNLGYCRMSAAFAGRIGEAQTKLGNYVGSYVGGGIQENSLATVEQLDPMGVDFRPSSRYLGRITELVRQGLEVNG